MAITKIKGTSSFTNLTKYDSFLAGNNINDYESIATVSGNGSATSLTFSSIPQTYTHLQLRFISRVDSANYTLMTFNGDSSASNYTWHQLDGNGSAASAGGATSGVFGGAVINFTSGGTSGIYSAAIVDLLDYTNTNKYKTVRSLTGVDKNGSGNIALNSNVWLSTSAITSLSITFNGGFAIATGSQFALYGIRG
jgi:hypothetical protein